MVYLSELNEQYPWSPHAETHYSDKEIYTHVFGEPSLNWEISVSPPMPGYAYVGIRVAVAGKPVGHTYFPKVIRESTKESVFAHPWDVMITPNTKWYPLAYPMPHRLFKQLNDIHIRMQHNDPAVGHIELIAQKFDDLLEDDKEISYVFRSGESYDTNWIQTPEDFYCAKRLETQEPSSWPKKYKILYPVQYYQYKNEWVRRPENNQSWETDVQFKSI